MSEVLADDAMHLDRAVVGSSQPRWVTRVFQLFDRLEGISKPVLASKN